MLPPPAPPWLGTLHALSSDNVRLRIFPLQKLGSTGRSGRLLAWQRLRTSPSGPSLNTWPSDQRTALIPASHGPRGLGVGGAAGN